MPILAALCDIFACGPDRLIATKAENTTTSKSVGQGPEVVDLAEVIRPKRARIHPDQ